MSLDSLSSNKYSKYVINTNKQVLINDEEIIDLNEVKDWFKNHYHEFIRPEASTKWNHTIRLGYPITTNQEMDTILQAIVEGYHVGVNKYCNLHYQKKVCNLSNDELRELKSNAYFMLDLENISTYNEMQLLE